MVKKNKWLNHHLKTFVKPHLGLVPAPKLYKFSEEQLSLLVACWKAAKKKADGKTILLAGRDVWELAILAGIDQTPIVFRPDISMLTLSHVTEDYQDLYLIDSGCSGSVPRALKVKSWGLVSGTNQIIPGNYSYSGVAEHLEESPKYWRRGSWSKDKIRQVKSVPMTFSKAAANTQAIVEVCSAIL